MDANIPLKEELSGKWESASDEPGQDLKYSSAYVAAVAVTVGWWAGMNCDGLGDGEWNQLYKLEVWTSPLRLGVCAKYRIN
jgi:hypothetical protein